MKRLNRSPENIHHVLPLIDRFLLSHPLFLHIAVTSTGISNITGAEQEGQ